MQEIETKRKRVVEIRNVSELIAIRKENERERLSQQQKEQKQQQLLQQQQQQDPRSKMYKSHIASTFVNSHYENIMGFHTNYADSVKPLQNETSMSKFRLDSIKCVNILLNLISSVHWQQKFDWFSLLLSGNCVEIGGTRVTPSQHPLGIRFINLLVAKMFVVSFMPVVVQFFIFDFNLELFDFAYRKKLKHQWPYSIQQMVL